MHGKKNVRYIHITNLRVCETSLQNDTCLLGFRMVTARSLLCIVGACVCCAVFTVHRDMLSKHSYDYVMTYCEFDSFNKVNRT